MDFCDSIDSDDVQLKQFFKFLADSGEMRDCAIFLNACTDLYPFNLDSGYVSPLRGQVVKFEMEEFVVDDSCYTSHGDEAPFSQQFFLEVPQLIVHLDNLISCEHETGMVSDPCRCFNLVEWLGTPLPMPNSSSIYPPVRKLRIYSWNVNNVVTMVGLITLRPIYERVGGWMTSLFAEIWMGAYPWGQMKMMRNKEGSTTQNARERGRLALLLPAFMPFHLSTTISSLTSLH